MTETPSEDVEPYVPDDDDLNQLIEYHVEKASTLHKEADQHSEMARTYGAILATAEDQRAPFEDEELTELIRVQDEELARVEAALSSRRGWVDRMKARVGLAPAPVSPFASDPNFAHLFVGRGPAGNGDVPPPPPPWESGPTSGGIAFKKEA